MPGERSSSAGATPRTLPAELATWPAWTPDEEQLGELELLTSGAFTPLAGYLTAADLAAVSARGQLADGTPWPVPVTLTVPAGAVPADAGHLVLQDPEGSPLAVLSITERVPADAAGAALRLAGPVTALRPPEHGPFRALRRHAGRGPRAARRRPPCSRTRRGGRSASGRSASCGTWPASCAPGSCCCRWWRARPSSSPGPSRLSAPCSPPARQLPGGTLVVPVPLPPRASPPGSCVPVPWSRPPTGRPTCSGRAGSGDGGAGGDGGARPRSAGDFDLSKLGVKILAEGEWAYDPVAEVWRPLG